MDYLDLTIRINSDSNAITTRLFEKIGKVNQLLHFQSNSAFGHYLGVFSSALFRFITLNTLRADFDYFRLQFYGKLRMRGYQPAFIRRLGRKCNMAWENKQFYIKRLATNYRIKKQNAIVKSNCFNSILRFFADEQALKHAVARVANEFDDDRLFFVKKFNRFYDQDTRLYAMLNTVLNHIGLERKVVISNKVDRKLGSLVIL